TVNVHIAAHFTMGCQGRKLFFAHCSVGESFKCSYHQSKVATHRLLTLDNNSLSRSCLLVLLTHHGLFHKWLFATCDLAVIGNSNTIYHIKTPYPLIFWKIERKIHAYICASST
ncbi:uncharacterized protein EI90DRAFT_3043018, partial [Cantharellus anzutake]|uniref:uncharacterized protein n=1 Tax=Cantharellus anzutake TaxID=1750568 RepID=UPI001908E122